jgi:HD superfamily phosphohydrolase
LAQNGENLFASPALSYFLTNDIQLDDFKNNPEVLNTFALLDDYDLLGAIKVWQHSKDKVLSILSDHLVNRKLFKIEIAKEPFSEERIIKEREIAKERFGITDSESQYFVYSEILTNNAYNQNKENINLLLKNGNIMDLSDASDNLNISALAHPVAKYCLCYCI